jgi:hypothetical protein
MTQAKLTKPKQEFYAQSSRKDPFRRRKRTNMDTWITEELTPKKICKLLWASKAAGGILRIPALLELEKPIWVGSEKKQASIALNRSKTKATISFVRNPR